MRKIRVGVIGQGRSGRNIHAKCLHERLRDRFEVGAVSDPRPERCEESHRETGCEVHTDYRTLLEDSSLDLVVNASMSDQHVPINLEIIAAGRNLLAEKPLAPTAADVDRMTEAAEKAGVLFAVFQQSRFAPTFLKLREILDSGILGRTVMIKVAFNGFARRWDWQTLQARVGGNLYNTGPHPLDQALQLFGDEDPSVFCLMDRVNTFGDAEDHVKVVLSGANRPTIDLEISSCAGHSPYVYQVYASCGGLIGDHARLEWKYFKPEEAPEQRLVRDPLPNRAYCGEELTWHTDSWESTPEWLSFDYRVEAFYASLYETMVNGAPLAVTVPQVRRQIAVIEECHRQNPLSRRFDEPAAGSGT